MKKLICFLAILVLFSLAGYAGEAAAAPQLSSGSSTDTCYAAGDVNGDGIVLTVSDLVEAIKIFTCEAPLPDSNLYQIDFNSDCRVDSADLRFYFDIFIYGPGILPRPFPVPTCCNPTVYPFFRGDLNNDGGLTPADAVLMLSCVFGETGSCHLFYADLTGDHALTPADVVQELNYVFLGTPPAGCP